MLDEISLECGINSVVLEVFADLFWYRAFLEVRKILRRDGCTCTT